MEELIKQNFDESGYGVEQIIKCLCGDVMGKSSSVYNNGN